MPYVRKELNTNTRKTSRSSSHVDQQPPNSRKTSRDYKTSQPNLNGDYEGSRERLNKDGKKSSQDRLNSSQNKDTSKMKHSKSADPIPGSAANGSKPANKDGKGEKSRKDGKSVAGQQDVENKNVDNKEKAEKPKTYAYAYSSKRNVEESKVEEKKGCRGCMDRHRKKMIAFTVFLVVSAFIGGLIWLFISFDFKIGHQDAHLQKQFLTTTTAPPPPDGGPVPYRRGPGYADYDCGLTIKNGDEEKCYDRGKCLIRVYDDRKDITKMEYHCVCQTGYTGDRCDRSSITGNKIDAYGYEYDENEEEE